VRKADLGSIRDPAPRDQLRATWQLL
jgi:hypothetical protein